MSELSVSREFKIESKLGGAFANRNAGKLNIKKQRLGVGIGANQKILVKTEFLKKVLPNIISTDPSHTDWNKIVNNYFNSFILLIPVSGYTIKLNYEFKNIKNKETAEAKWNDIHNKLNKQLENNTDGSAIYKAYQDYYFAIFNYYTDDKEGIIKNIDIEDPFQYLIYCYCLVHNKVANRESDLSKSKNIKYLLTDKEQLKAKEKDMFQLNNKAEKLYHGIMEDEKEVDNMLLLFTEDIRRFKDIEDKQMTLKTLMLSNIHRFIKYAEDDDLAIKAFVEKCILLGLLKRIPGSTMIADADNTIIGQTIEETVFYLKDTKNSGFATKLENALKGKL